jgi:5'-methylthioadenosine phosphorylase
MHGKKIGIIGGSGLYQMDVLKKVEKINLRTPYGKPSDAFVRGEYGGCEIFFLPRHGAGHRILPSEINYRANICGMKMLGVDTLISVTAVGSMKENIHPGQIVIPDQFFDRTRGRKDTFFGEGVVAHVIFADPTCLKLNYLLAKAGKEEGAFIHEGGCYICIEGPQFSTRAESRVYRQLGVDIIGMTEAKLAREAEICFATLAIVTDYDCWYRPENDVSVNAILEVLRKNVELSKRIILNVVAKLKDEKGCACNSSLEYAIMTDRKRITPAMKRRLKAIAGKYLG